VDGAPAIDCKIDHLSGTQAVNYLTSHDVEGFRKERLYTQMTSDVPLATSEALFDRGHIEAVLLASIKADGRDPGPNEVHDRASETILHRARLRRIKLGFVCQLTPSASP
jgi:hypothetical protein